MDELRYKLNVYVVIVIYISWFTDIHVALYLRYYTMDLIHTSVTDYLWLYFPDRHDSRANLSQY